MSMGILETTDVKNDMRSNTMKNVKDYKCTACGKENVKLWRPWGYNGPLICANCAETRQLPRECEELKWEEKDGKYVGNHTGKFIKLDKWTIDENGCIPTTLGVPNKNLPSATTNILEINISDIDSSFSSSGYSYVPAVMDEHGVCFTIPLSTTNYNWWKNLPTR